MNQEEIVEEDASEEEIEEEVVEEVEEIEEPEPEVVEEAVEEVLEEEVAEEIEEPVVEQADTEWDDSELTLAEADQQAEEFAPEQLAAALSDAFKERWWEDDTDEAAA